MILALLLKLIIILDIISVCILWIMLKFASKQKTTTMPTQYFLPVIHPTFELLKRSSRMLHFIGASLILANGLHLLEQHESARLLCYFQLIIAVEIYLVLFFAKSLLTDSPGLNAFFRMIETLTLLGIAFTLFSYEHNISGTIHLMVSAGFFFLFYREWRMMRSESINIKQTGVSIPNFVKDEEIGWPEIKSIIPKYHTIIIETIRNKTIQFQLRRNLKIEELQQIDEFCRQHLIS
jgi:uncharacterized protein YggT (Ycf19 family)